MTDHNNLERRVTALEEHVRRLAHELVSPNEELRLDVIERQIVALHHALKYHVYVKLDRIETELDIDVEEANQ